MDKSVLITGTNHGLGLGLTKVFLDNGYNVFAGVYDLTVDSQIQSIKDRDGLYIVDLDVSDTQSVDKSAGYIKGITQSLEIIINNAGILCKDSYDKKHYTIFDRLDAETMKEAYNVNALGALRVANAFTPLLMNGNEKLLVNISSEAGSLGACKVSDWHGYRMSKAAMNMAGVLIHNEYIKHGAKVWQIHPGWVQTYMHGDRYDVADHTPEYAAENIFNLIQNAETYNSDKAVYMDLFGEPWPW